MPPINPSYEQNPDGHDILVSEADIEERFIEKLCKLKYSHRPDIHDLEALEANFRKKFERLNAVTLSDSEFARLLDQITTPDVYKSAELLRGINSFERDDGTPLNFTLVNIKDWCKNDYEIVSQLRINTRSSFHRYDVILLINGIPCVQIELKTLEISPRRAMQQIVDYKADPGNGYTNTLLAFMQLFIVSNRTNTYYFANNNNRHFAFDAKELFLPVYQYADRGNKKIAHLDRFAEAFLPKCTLGHMISRYMVLVASEQKLLMMRPYQIYAVKDIVDCIHQSTGNGYIWHTTGSGKTLTSFKASTLLKDNPDIDKCLFVVDRKDLDRQTREEFNRFQEDCVEENTNTYTLVRRLLSTDYADKVIVTTIQKLGLPNTQAEIERRQQIEAWLDTGMGCCVLRHAEAADFVQNALLHFHPERYHLHAWCIMPNHIHILVEPITALATIIQGWKSYTARWILKEGRQLGWQLPKGKSLWDREYWDRYIRDEPHYRNTVSYIHNNPVKAGLCQSPSDWHWSSF